MLAETGFGVENYVEKDLWSYWRRFWLFCCPLDVEREICMFCVCCGWLLLAYILGKNQISVSSLKVLDSFVSSSDTVFVDFLVSIFTQTHSTNWISIVRLYINFAFC